MQALAAAPKAFGAAALFEGNFKQTVLHPLFENQPLNWRGGACLRAF
jgi:hypothetical protein